MLKLLGSKRLVAANRMHMRHFHTTIYPQQQQHAIGEEHVVAAMKYVYQQKIDWKNVHSPEYVQKFAADAVTFVCVANKVE
jgi:hypothetical protein